MIAHCSFYYSPFGHVYRRATLLHWVYVLGRVHMRAYSWDSSWCIFWVRVWVIHSIFVREVSDISLVSLDPYSIHHSIYFRCDYFPYFDAGWPSLTFLSFLLYFIFVLFLHFTLLHLIYFFSHLAGCLTWVQHSHFILVSSMCLFFYHHFRVWTPRSGTHDVFYTLHFMHEGYGDYIIGIFEPSFLSFRSP